MPVANQYICPECQRVLRVGAMLQPGQKIRCPACQAIFAPTLDTRPASPIRPALPPAFSERDDEDARRPVADDYPRARRADDDTYPPPRRRPEESDDDDEWDSPGWRKRRRPKSTGTAIVLGGLALVLLIGGFVVTAFVWPGFLLEATPPERTVQPLSPATEALLAHMPANPSIIVGVDLTEVQGRNDLERVAAKIPGELTRQLAVLKPALADQVNHLECVVAAAENMGMFGPESFVIAARTKTDFKPDVIRATVNATAVPGKPYYRLPGFGNVSLLAMPDNRTILLTNGNENKLEAVLKADRTRLHADTRDTLARAGRSVAWAFIKLEGMLGQQFQNDVAMGGGLPMNREDKRAMEALRQAKAIAFWAESGSTVSINMGFAMNSDDDARTLWSTSDRSWRRDKRGNANQVRNKLGMMMLQGKDQQLVEAVLNDVENNMTFYKNGKLVTFSVPLSDGTTKSIASLTDEKLLPLLADNRGGGGPIGPVPNGFNPQGFNPQPVNRPGKVVFNVRARLEQKDPRDRVRGMPHKVHFVQFSANRTYQIDMVGDNNWDTFLRLENPQLVQLAQDDDSGGNGQARILFTPNTTQAYHIIATAWGGGLGEYTLTVRELD